MKYKKYKHEELIRNIAMAALLISMILMRIEKTPIQIILAVASLIICLLGGIYFVYKGSKLGGAMMFCISLALILGILSQYFNSDILFVPIPSLIIGAMLFGYKIVVNIGDKGRIETIRKNVILAIVLCSIFQIVMIVTAFVQH
jgi:hypothetical protein